MSTAVIQVPFELVQKWQEIVNIIAEIIHVPSALVMKVEPPNIKVFVSSESNGNPYERDEIIRRKSAQFPVALSRSYAEDLASIRSPGSHDDRCTWLQNSGLSSAVKNVVCFDEHLMSLTGSYDSFHGMRAGKVNTSLPPFFLTGGQIRAARSLIRWTAENLAAASALSVATIRRAELKENQTALTSANDLAIATHGVVNRRRQQSQAVSLFITDMAGRLDRSKGNGVTTVATPFQ